VFSWIWFPSRRLSAISAQLDREYLVLRIDEGGRCCTTETLKTHKTDISEVVYPWHPFYGQEAKIKGERNRRGTIVYVCSSDGNDGGAVVEVPAWMFDSAVCCLLHPGTQPSVCVPALRALHALLNWTRKPTEDVIEAHQSTALGGSDAQTSKDAGDSDSPLSGTCPNAAVVPGHQSQDRTSFGSITSPTRKPKHRRTK
ncbi:MAG TPA: hypothetical protein VM715_11755, partial [Candidatus Acidoferrum sp.]|nr:hypothetical protein [Candidatus Acidoferrum sp.]